VLQLAAQPKACILGSHSRWGREARKPIPIERREPELRVTRWTPPEDVFADLSYAEL
jgi:hypothetical protein